MYRVLNRASRVTDPDLQDPEDHDSPSDPANRARQLKYSERSESFVVWRPPLRWYLSRNNSPELNPYRLSPLGDIQVTPNPVRFLVGDWAVLGCFILKFIGGLWGRGTGIFSVPNTYMERALILA